MHRHVRVYKVREVLGDTTYMYGRPIMDTTVYGSENSMDGVLGQAVGFVNARPHLLLNVKVQGCIGRCKSRA